MGSATHKTVSAQNKMLISKVASAAEERLPRVRFPIRMKITLPYVILALLLALGAAYVITQIVVDNLETGQPGGYSPQHGSYRRVHVNDIKPLFFHEAIEAPQGL